jgi:hypothetical protein
MKKYIVTLTEDERKTLGDLKSKGMQKSQKILNALILLDCDEGEYQTERSTNEEIARVLQISMRKIDRVKKRFVEEGLDAALDKKVGSRIYNKKTDGDFEAHLVALSCGEPPEGFARWSLRLLADKAVELNYIDSISHESVRRILKNEVKLRRRTRAASCGVFIKNNKNATVNWRFTTADARFKLSRLYSTLDD